MISQKLSDRYNFTSQTQKVALWNHTDQATCRPTHTQTHTDINKKAPTQTQPTNQACLYCWWFSLYCVGFGGKQIEFCGEKLATWQSFLLKAARQQQRCLISEGFSPSHTRRGADWELEFHLGINGRMWTLLTLQLVWLEQRRHRGGVKPEVWLFCTHMNSRNCWNKKQLLQISWLKCANKWHTLRFVQ